MHFRKPAVMQNSCTASNIVTLSQTTTVTSRVFASSNSSFNSGVSECDGDACVSDDHEYSDKMHSVTNRKKMRRKTSINNEFNNSNSSDSHISASHNPTLATYLGSVDSKETFPVISTYPAAITSASLEQSMICKSAAPADTNQWSSLLKLSWNCVQLNAKHCLSTLYYCYWHKNNGAGQLLQLFLPVALILSFVWLPISASSNNLSTVTKGQIFLWVMYWFFLCFFDASFYASSILHFSLVTASCR